MNDYSTHFKGKKIVVMGLGLLGRGVGDAEFLAKNGAILTITDLKSTEELQPSLERLREFKNISYTLGEHKLEDFKDKDFILKAAGVPLDSPFIKEARKNNIPIKMSASWFAELTDIPIVGVTGTRGKTTTTYLIYEILKNAKKEVLLGGNIRGVSNLSLLESVSKNSVGVFELDSWQCQGWGEAKISPDISIFTTFMRDHMNYYSSMDEYLNDKAQIFLHQEENDVLVVSNQVGPLIKEKYGSSIRSQLAVVDSEGFPKEWNLHIPGEHNKLNAMCAIAAGHALDINDQIIRDTVENFQGVPGRLKLVREVNGVRIYDDSTSTTPDATITALKSLGSGSKNIVLIFGGTDKELDATALVQVIPEYTKKAVVLDGTGTDKIKKRLEEKLGTMIDHSTLESAVVEAWESAEPGDIILFSPGFASFGMFENEYERGDQFNSLVEKLS